ncbi:MAG: hypothetical protein Q9215_003019 [Flavoplaca cf. flavocitrina]
MHAFDVCKGKMARVDKKRKCHELKPNKLYSGKACGKDRRAGVRTWEVNTNTRYGNGIKISFDSGGSKVSHIKSGSGEVSYSNARTAKLDRRGDVVK